ncbi:BZ3500_MvSof-1268-A1-R1_Chr7-1g09106 [Microbotryum saponariae]|uniref:BZ3500_MvSof-1268-A1-R1_Chr7-1g09106 protein n=1 Tax=Microbotryum saponariae TaxID=289078 RepID=A0A2X0LQ77_9BASI|nr:BZ3501_MvSof-1269-A2-R1_Chr7-1g08811 [Microbotryum saponariae]SDA02814.1 BZ3500_MvSof-1268-A1-R1_Chr7-1g09106 [Microbotryum saponariae]
MLLSFDLDVVNAEGLLRSLLVLLPLLRLRDLMTSVLREMGLGRPFILKKRAQALHRMCELSCDLRQSGVVCAEQTNRVSSPWA